LDKRSAILSSVILVVIGLFTGVLLGMNGFVSSSSGVKAIEYSYIYSTKHTGLEDAEWKIVFYVVNRGDVPLSVSNVYVNSIDVDLYGLIHGEGLGSASLIGTSVPEEGYSLDPGEGVEIYIWLGGGCFESGDMLSVSVNPVNMVQKYCQVTIY